MTKGPVLISYDTDDAPSPAEAPQVPDIAPQGHAMQSVAQIATRRPSRLLRWFLGLALTLILALISIAAWDFTMALIARNTVLGYIITALFALLALIALAITLRELAEFSRLRRIDKIQHAAETALASADLNAARDVTNRLTALYKSRPDTEWGRDRFTELAPDQLDAQSLLSLAETELLTPLDAAAQREVEAAARQVATVTAIVPLALADLIAALTANTRMIRRIAEIYGGRAGTLGSWRLLRAVMAHLVATGAVAVGDDMLGSIAGGGVLAKLSRRFGEGLVNGALTARVGVAAIEVCRPLPFTAQKRPSVSKIVSRALTGLFGRSE